MPFLIPGAGALDIQKTGLTLPVRVQAISLKRAQLLQREPRGKSLLFITLIHFDGPVGRPVQKITGMAGSSKTTMVLED